MWTAFIVFYQKDNFNFIQTFHKYINKLQAEPEPIKFEIFESHIQVGRLPHFTVINWANITRSVQIAQPSLTGSR